MKKLLSVLLCSTLFLANSFADDSNWFMAQTKKAPIESITATSELVEAQFEGKYLYPPVNIVDGDFANTWCEAETNGPGIGEAITIEFTEPVSFDEIQIVNGFATKDYYGKNNRIKSIQITQVAKKHFQQKTYTLEDNKPTWQSIKFELTQTAQTITFKIMDVYKGSKYDDTCLDDVRLLYKGKVIPFENVATIKASQEQNSKDMLNSSTADFEKEFFALFNASPTDNYYKYLVLVADNKEDAMVLTKYSNNNKLKGVYSGKIYKKTTVTELTNKVQKMSNYGWYYPYFPSSFGSSDYNKLSVPYSLVFFDNSSWNTSMAYNVRNHKIICDKTVSYVTTTTSTTVKLDGKSIYLNGVHYTIVDNSDYAIVEFYPDGY